MSVLCSLICVILLNGLNGQRNGNVEMLFNANKSKVMRMGYNNKLAEYDMNDVKFHYIKIWPDLTLNIVSKYESLL